MINENKYESTYLRTLKCKEKFYNEIILIIKLFIMHPFEYHHHQYQFQVFDHLIDLNKIQIAV